MTGSNGYHDETSSDGFLSNGDKEIIHVRHAYMITIYEVCKSLMLSGPVDLYYTAYSLSFEIQSNRGPAQIIQIDLASSVIDPCI